MIHNPQQFGDKVEPSQSFAVPAISLLKGGGAIRSMAVKFAANPVTGTGSLTVPILTSPTRSGIDPQLAHSYTTRMPATGRSVSVGISPCRRSPARPAWAYRNIGRDIILGAGSV